MDLLVKLNLDDLWTGSNWDETVGQLIAEELRATIKAEIRKSIKTDKNLEKLIKAYKDRAVKEAMEKVGI